MPISIKDNLATKGVRTTAGSKILAEWKPNFDATVVAKLRETGAIHLGKTNMHEWAGGGTTINPYYGATRNPWDTSRIPGGSSGGSAAAVAASMCVTSIGTDNAGSVRNPAAMCGVVGLKPTYGRVSVFGGVPGTGGYSTNHFGIFTKTAKDCTLVLQAIAGKDPGDALSSDEPVPNYSKNIGKNPLGEWGRMTAPAIRTKGIRDYAYLAIKRKGAPMHFSEVAETIGTVFSKKAHVATTHNELIKDPSFVLVGRGLYALTEWGYTPGVVRDVIRDVLKAEGPLKKDEVIKHVKKARFVKDNTILVNLNDSRYFKRMKDGRYSAA